MSPAAQRRVLLAAVCGLASCLMLLILTLPAQRRGGTGGAAGVEGGGSSARTALFSRCAVCAAGS